MTTLIRCSDDVRDALYEWGHGLGLYTMPQILAGIVEELGRGHTRDLYAALGRPERTAKPLKNRRVTRKCIQPDRCR